MKKIIVARNLSNDDTQKFHLQLPRHCPCCHTAIVTRHLDSYFLKDQSTPYGCEDAGTLYSFYFCSGCEKCFLAEYRVFVQDSRYISDGDLCGLIPYGHETTSFSDKINKLSPNFVKIYNQSEQAESTGLLEICGMGYRKALEFLVKDYAISKYPDRQNEIESSMLGKCINSYIDNEKIKTLAKASAWIGNDETHYVQKHQNYNLQDLKRFVTTAIAYIEYELNYAEAVNFLDAH